jgi:hypothetical protein
MPHPLIPPKHTCSDVPHKRKRARPKALSPTAHSTHNTAAHAHARHYNRSVALSPIAMIRRSPSDCCVVRAGGREVAIGQVGGAAICEGAAARKGKVRGTGARVGDYVVLELVGRNEVRELCGDGDGDAQTHRVTR